jgi:hypothetical protein
MEKAFTGLHIGLGIWLGGYGRSVDRRFAKPDPRAHSRIHLSWVGQGVGQRLLKFLLCPDHDSRAATD